MLNKLNTSRSALFLRINRAFSKVVVEELFKQVSKDRVGNYSEKIIRKDYADPIRCKVSYLLFKFEDEPSFLVGSEFVETKYAFLLLVEVGNILAVIKKNVVGVEDFLDDRCERLEYEEISGLFSDDDTAYEKIALSNMGISKSAILRRTMESDNLKGQLSSQSSRRSVANTATVRTKDHRHVLRPHSSALSKADSRSGIDELLSWVNFICLELARGIRTNDFLESFAQPVKFEQVRDTLVPSGLLLNINRIREILETDGVLLFRGRVLSEERLNQCITFLESTFFVHPVNGKFQIVVEVDGVDRKIGYLKVNEKSITIESRWLKDLEIIHPETEGSLHRLMSRGQDFIVTFSTLEYIYTNRRIFRDKGIGVHCKEIQSCLVSHNFGAINGEKGEPATNAIAFPPGSIFHFVEQSLRGSGALICDDFGDEWADFIEISDNPHGVRLLHCKHGKESTSASQLHVVVSQALKNLGRTSFTQGELDAKLVGWQNLYARTQITRIRTTHSPDDIRAISSSIASAPHVEREIGLVVPFLVKAELDQAFTDIERGAPVSAHVTQLVWLLSTFISACKENGQKPLIYCS